MADSGAKSRHHGHLRGHQGQAEGSQGCRYRRRATSVARVEAQQDKADAEREAAKRDRGGTGAGRGAGARGPPGGPRGPLTIAPAPPREQQPGRGRWAGSVTAPHVPLSVLDLAPVGEGSTPAAALQASLVLAREAERLGYPRYWVAEHHNMPGIASSSPAVLLAHLPPVTVDHPARLRRSHAAQPLPARRRRAVRHARGAAPGPHRPRHRPRARAPTSSPPRALRRVRTRWTRDDFPDAAGRAVRLLRRRIPRGPPVPLRSPPCPACGYRPAIWLLGSQRLQRAGRPGMLGLPFSFAHHFAAGNTLPAAGRLPGGVPALGRARRALRDARRLVMCAETDERGPVAGRVRARWPFLRLRRAVPGRYPTPEEAAAYYVHARRNARSCGPGPARTSSASPDTVRARARRAGRSHRGRRADDHDDDARPRRPAAVLPARRRGCWSDARPRRSSVGGPGGRLASRSNRRSEEGVPDD